MPNRHLPLAVLVLVCSSPAFAATKSECSADDAPALTLIGDVTSESLAADVRALAASQKIVFSEVLERAQGAVESTRKAIKDINGEIKTLEAQNTQKVTEIGQLQQQVVVRKNQIASNAERSRRIGLIGALFGMPMVGVAGIIQAQDQDARVRQLNGEISRLNEQKAGIDRRIARYQSDKKVLTGKLKKLEELEKAIPAEPPAPRANTSIHRYFVNEIARLGVRKALAANLRQQLAVLTEIRDEAKDLGGTLDQAIADLKASVRMADQLAKDSQEEFLGLFKMLLSKDPNAAAGRWLQSRLQSKVEEARGQVRSQVTSYVDGLVNEAIPEQSSFRDQLTQQLIGSILGG